MADYNIFFPILREFEGGYVWDPVDPGGETYRGIARAYNPGWAGWQRIDAAKIKLGIKGHPPVGAYNSINKALGADAALQQAIQAFYKPLYWDVLKLDQVRSQALANQLGDHSASAGPARPARMIQFALNQLRPGTVVEDAKVGPATVAAINAADQTALLKAFVQLRKDFYEYRAAARTPAPAVVGLLQRLNLSPNATQAKFLKSWLRRLPKL